MNEKYTIFSHIFDLVSKLRERQFRCFFSRPNPRRLHSLLSSLYSMAENTGMIVPDSKKPFTMTVHRTTFPTMFVKLDGTNYRVWSQIMEMHNAGRRNKGYIT